MFDRASGNYKITSAGVSLVPKNKVSITGDGIGHTTLLPYGNVAAIHLEGSITTPLSDVRFSDFTIDGANQSGTYASAIKGIYITYLQRCTFERLHIKNTGATGMGCDFLKDCKITDVIAEGCGRLGSSSSAGAAGIGVGVSSWDGSTVFARCVTRNNKRAGIFFESQDGTFAQGYAVINHFSEGNGDHGIGDAGCDGLQIVSSVSRNNVGAGVGFYAGTIGNGRPGKNAILSTLDVYGNSNNGLFYDTNVRPSMGGFRVTNSRFCNNAGHGMDLNGANGTDVLDIVIENCEIAGNQMAGMYFWGGFQRASILNNRIRNNGASGNYATGMFLDATFTDGEISGNHIWDDQATKTQKYGIDHYGGALAGNSILRDNDARGNSLGAFTFIASVSSTVIMRNNTGYNPLGQSSVTVTASPFTYTAGRSSEDLYINGGNVSNITKNGVTLATASPARIHLEPGQSIIVTYSTIPTIITDRL